jgi:glycosyltransferase involved in cell wall biosynthesis
VVSRADVAPPVIPGRRPRLLAYTDNDLIGGAEMSLVTLIGALGDAVEPSIMATHRPVLDWIAERCPGVPATLVPHAANKRDLRAIGAHIRAVHAQRPEIFHANLHHSWAGTYGILAAMLASGVRTVAVEHSLWTVEIPAQRRRRRALDSRLDAHVAVSERLARDVERMLGLEPNSIETIHNGVADARPEPLPRLRPEPTLGFVGRLATEEKGLDVLLRAAARIPDAALVLVGDGPDRPRLEALAGQLGIAGRVVFAGWSDEVRRVLPSFDVLVQPSRREGFGIALVEAMLAEVPVVATAVGGMSEVVVDGVTGTIVHDHDPAAVAAAADALLRDPDRRRAMGQAGRRVALERFSAPAMARSFAALYGRVLER